MRMSNTDPRVPEFLDHIQEQIIDAHTNQPPPPDWDDPNLKPFADAARETYNAWRDLKVMSTAIARDNARRDLRLVLRGRGEEALEPFPWEQE